MFTKLLNNRAARGLFAAVIAVALTACSSASTTTHSESDWLKPEARKTKYQKILVVSAAEDSDVRRVLEDRLAEEINASGATAYLSYRIGRKMEIDELTRETVVAMVEETGADAVLVTRVVDREAHAAKTQEELILYVGPTVRVVQDEDRNFSSVTYSNYALEVVPSDMIAEGNAMLESSLYEAAGTNGLVYRAMTKADITLDGGQPIEQSAYEIASGIAKKLRRDGVIR